MGCAESKSRSLLISNTVRPETEAVKSMPEDNNIHEDCNCKLSCPITTREAYKIKQSWKAIRRNMESTGVEMFLRLFKTSSHLQTMFQGFKDIRSDDELRSNEALEYHATLVMTTLDDAITHIDNYDFVKQLLSKTGASHVKFAGFKSTNFLAIKEPFLEAVRVTLGDRYTENMQNIYTIAIIFILETLKQGMEEALEKAGSSEVAQGNIRV
ncbi:neuroglobin isoform X3 [Aplysia californica]|uniref:Globin n=1 Tax=Aplysia californica TaxID=6500 RepID=A0ABM1VNR7_APLCA|nr:neuroglobin isoform X3 [Aplysia californica]XP_035824059.1 neuroglobin isoform X3 [Aplysia californica]